MAPVKVARLKSLPSPKIVLVGGSNLSMGLDCARIEKAFKRPVMNMGLHGGLGLGYMLAEVRPYIRSGDFVVLAPEYTHYHCESYYGNKEVLGVIFDVMPAKRKDVSARQWAHLLRYIPNYAAKKLMNSVSRLTKNVRQGEPCAQTFDAYGDAVGHWQQADMPVVPLAPCGRPSVVNPDYMDGVQAFVEEMQGRGAKVVILPPCCQATSFDNTKPLVSWVEEELRRRHLPLGAPMARYRMADNLCTGTPYHLNKKGVDLRTTLVIEDLRRWM